MKESRVSQRLLVRLAACIACACTSCALPLAAQTTAFFVATDDFMVLLLHVGCLRRQLS